MASRALAAAAPSELDAFDYELPPESIAQHPAPERDAARLLVLERSSGRRHHSYVRALPDWLRDGDLLVVNATRVLPAKLRGRKASGGSVEALLLEDAGGGRHRALLRSGGRQRPGLRLHFAGPGGSLEAELVEALPDGSVWLAFEGALSPYALGEAPLPPYIRRAAPLEADRERYQTTFARVPGSVAAPTAGLHLSERLLSALEARGIGRAELVLHVGPGTFRPLDAATLERGELHPERFELPPETAARIEATRRRGGRIVAVGTTTLRVLESCCSPDGRLRAGSGTTRLFLRPGSPFRAADALLTNFHLPRSSLLMLVAGFAGRESVLSAYAEAVRRGYRFYSYGDAMLIP